MEQRPPPLRPMPGCVTAGTERLIAGIAIAREDDNEHLARGNDLSDDLLEYFRRVPGQ